MLAAFAIPIGLFGLYDQTVPRQEFFKAQMKKMFERDRDFVALIEDSLRPGSAIYQLPYTPFPEAGPQPHTYELLAGFLHSKSLHWSYGGMRGREGDLFYRELAQQPLEEQLEVIKRLGFAGVYIDRRGFQKDNADRLIAKLSSLLATEPTFIHGGGKAVFFKIEPAMNVDLQGLTPTQIMQKIGYFPDKTGTSYPATLSEGIDFVRSGWPEFVRNVEGMPVLDSWHRWSETSRASLVRFEFHHKLPKKFTLVLSAQPPWPSMDQDLIMRLGSQEHRLKITAGIWEMRLPIELTEDYVDFVEFIPSDSTLSQLPEMSGSSRGLGIGFIRLRFEE